MKIQSKHRKIAGFVFLLAMVCSLPIVFAATPSTNSAGITLVRASTEVSGGAASANSSGVKLENSKPGDHSVDTTNSAGITAYIGQLDPVNPDQVIIQNNAKAVYWIQYK